MRILKVSLLNLNSLKGEHIVDFDAEPLASAGLFAITGPTGAGKTTLLDAITLGLFGRAARYGNEPSPEDVMSRGTGECRAEVTFSVKGQIYIAKWSLARARGKVDGKMQNPKREVSDPNGNLLADSLKSSAEKVEELLGLDYERFMRSVMLAQGQFSRFLTSKASDRAALLESLTGTEIYSRLGQLAYSETQIREAGIKDRMDRIDHIVLLNPDQRQQEATLIAGTQAEQAEVKTRLDAISKVRGRIESLQKAEAEIFLQEEELQGLEAEQRQNLQDLFRLENHRKAAPHADAIVRHDAAVADIDTQRAEYQQAKDDQEMAAGDLGQAIANFRKALADVAKQQNEEIAAAEKAKMAAEFRIKALQAWLDDNKQDAVIASKIGSLGGAIQERDSSAEALVEAWGEWADYAVELHPEAAKALPVEISGLPVDGLAKVLSAYIDAIDLVFAERKKALEAADKDLVLKRDHLQKTILLQNYEEQRAQLKDGEPCALCGSTHHPFAKGAHKFAPASQLEKDLKKAEKEFKMLKVSFDQAADSVKSVKGSSNELRKKHATCLTAATKLTAQLQKAGLNSEDNADVEVLQGRANAYGDKVQELKDAQDEVKTKIAAIREAKRIVGDVAKEQERFAKVPTVVKVGAPDRGDIDREDAEEAYDDAVGNFSSADAGLAAVTKAFKAAEAELAAALKQVEAAASKAGFRSVKELKEARMEAKEADRIEKAKGRIDTQVVAAQAKRDSAKATVAALVREGVPRGAMAAGIQQDYDQLYAKNNDLTTRIADARGRLRADDQQVAERERLVREIGEEGKTVEAWRQLRELIGSADGSKFRKFAQSITLELLIRHANRHMLQLSDRYKILREPMGVDSKGHKTEDELGLIVEDYYQANARRPMASLSGGESFLASLALALGLSDLAGRSVRIETLFIDEGFGTLDPETLDIALTALEGLREGNKSVGIISHVEALKERITAQVVVSKSSSGHSVVQVVGR